MDSTDSSDKKYFDIAKPRSNKPATAPTLRGPKRQMINLSDDQKPPEESSPKSSIEDDTVVFDDTLIDPGEAFEPAGSSNALSRPELNVPEHVDIDENDNNTKTDESSTQESEATKSTDDEDIPFVDPLPGTIKEEPQETKDENDESDSQETNEPETEENDEKEATSSYEPKVNTEAEQGQQSVTEKPIDPSKQVNTPAPLPDRFVASDALPDPDQTSTEETKDNAQDPNIFDTKEYYVPIGNTHHSHGGLKMAFAFGILCAAVVVGAVLFYMLKIGK